MARGSICLCLVDVWDARELGRSRVRYMCFVMVARRSQPGDTVSLELLSSSIVERIALWLKP
jgi:hypothetical protein